MGRRRVSCGGGPDSVSRAERAQGASPPEQKAAGGRGICLLATRAGARSPGPTSRREGWGSAAVFPLLPKLRQEKQKKKTANKQESSEWGEVEFALPLGQE